MTYQYNLTVTLLNGSTNISPSYLDADVSTNVPALSYLNDGIYDLWCIDREIAFTLNQADSGYYGFSSTEVQDGLVDTPLKEAGASLVPGSPYNYDEIDKINWLLNQNYIGTDAFGTGTITVTNIQQAAWVLLNQYPSTFVPNSRVKALLDAANNNGGGFIASAGKKQGLVISNFTINAYGETQPRTQPFLLLTQAAEIHGHTSIPLRFMRELNDKNGLRVKKYLPLQIIKPGEFSLKGLTAGFKYIFKPLRERKLSYSILGQGERSLLNIV